MSLDIKKYVNEYGIISDVDDIITELSDNYSDKEICSILKEIIMHNDTRYKEMKHDIDAFNNASRQVSHVLQEEILPEKKLQVKTGININISKYMEQLEKANDENSLIILLNSITDDNVISLIKFKLLEYITMYKKEILIDKDNADYYLNEISLLNYKLDYIINYEKIVNSPSLTLCNKKSSLDIEKSSFFIILHLRTMYVLWYNLFSKGCLII